MSEGNGYASAVDLLACKGTRYADVEVDGKKFRIRSLSELAKSQYEEGMKNKKGELRQDRLLDARCALLVECLVDGAGNQILNRTQIPELRKLDGRTSGALYDAIMQHCGWKDSDIEGLVKNSPETHGDGSS